MLRQKKKLYKGGQGCIELGEKVYKHQKIQRGIAFVGSFKCT